MAYISKRKRAPVRLPSDSLTEKEIEALHGECKTYHLGEPMIWKEFKVMPEDLQVEYIQKLRKKFGAPDGDIAKMLGVSRGYFCEHIKKLDLKCDHHTNDWDRDGFLAWAGTVEVNQLVEGGGSGDSGCVVDKTIEELLGNKSHRCDLAEHCEKKRIHDAGPIAFAGNNIPVIPKNGSMYFENNRADDVFKTMKAILGDTKVTVNVDWTITEE